jgi:hypothetical protein
VSCLRSVLLSRGRRYTHPGRVNNVNAVEVKASDARREAARQSQGYGLKFLPKV